MKLLQKNRLISTNLLHKETRLLKIKDIQEVKILCFVNNCLLGKCPSHFEGLFRERERVYNFRGNLLQTPRTKTEFGATSVRVYGSQLWNKLAGNMKKLRYQLNFKKHIAKSIIDTYQDT